MNAADFWKRVAIGTLEECWEWQGHRNERGYGRITNKRDAAWPRSIRAHRLAYELAHGVHPAALHVRHKCDNPPCCNPAHLELGTAAENAQDKVQRGRAHSMPGSHHPNAKLSEETVRQIRAKYQRGKYGDSARAAREFGVSKTTVAQVLRGEIWRHVQ